MAAALAGALGAAPKVIDGALKLVDLWKKLEDARAAETRLLRLLYVEVCQNLELLGRARLDDDEIASTDPAYAALAAAIETEAHLAVLLVRDETAADRDALAALREQAATWDDAERRRAERLEAFREVWGDLCDATWEIALAPEEAGATPPPSKQTTMLRSVAFVAVKVPALARLVTLPEAALPALRSVRTAVRLEHIRQHESALKRHLETLPAVQPIRC